MTNDNNEFKTKHGRGRPKGDSARERIVGVRFSKDELDMIEHLMVESGDNMTEIMRKALQVYYPIRLNQLRYE